MTRHISGVGRSSLVGGVFETFVYRLIPCLSIGLWDGVAVGASVACGWCGRGTNAQPSSYII